MTAAPLHRASNAAPPPGGEAVFATAADGTRLRFAFWSSGAPQSARGTAVFFNGRTEFIEKYYEAYARLSGLGYDVATLDWRGQGLSERPLSDPRKGHVARFSDYQLDVDALMSALAARGAPRPWRLLAHSMGGAIAARAMMRQHGLGADRRGGGPFPTAAREGFATLTLSAPMFGLHGSNSYNVLSRSVAALAVRTGRGRDYVPGPQGVTTAELGFSGNVLTNDQDRFAAYASLVGAHEGLALGGPTWRWVAAAYEEMQLLRPTTTPTLVLVGDQDTVVSVQAARTYADQAPAAEFVLLVGCRHEPFLESDAVQDVVWSKIEAFFKRTAA